MQLTWIDFVVFGSFMAIVMAIASYEWMSAITLVIVAWWFLPKFLKAGIYTIYGALRLSSGPTCSRTALCSSAALLLLSSSRKWERDELDRPITNAFILRIHDYSWYYPLALVVLKKTGSLKKAMQKYRKSTADGAPAFLRHYVKNG